MTSLIVRAELRAQCLLAKPVILLRGQRFTLHTHGAGLSAASNDAHASWPLQSQYTPTGKPAFVLGERADD